MKSLKNKWRKGIVILLPLLIAAMMIPVISVSAARDPFTDVSRKDWYYESVKYAYDYGLMNGVSDDQFAPQTTMSRAMIVTVLYRMEGEPYTSSSAFLDVPSGTWYTDAVAWAAENNIVNGYSRDHFGPSDDVTREQIAAILYRYADSCGYDVSEQADLSGYRDYDRISDWAEMALSWSNAKGLILGRDENKLAPEANATRAEVATILQRFCENVVDSSEDGENTYTVTYDYNYEDKGEYRTMKVEEGEPIGEMDPPVREGYRFVGWFTDPEEGEEISSDEIFAENLTLYAHWTEHQTVLPKPDHPSEADNYYWDNSEKVLRVENVSDSEDTLTETEAIALLQDRGFDQYKITSDFSADGTFIDETEAVEGKASKHPMYQTVYVTEAGNAWSVYVVDGEVFANPLFYNLESGLESELLISETETLTSYDSETNTFYVTVPKSSGAIVKTVNSIDADTLDELTVEEIDNL